MFVSCVGSVKLTVTNALALPVTCHAPALAAVGCSVVATPLMTVPKFRSRSVAIVIPTVTTTASADTDEPACAAARPVKPTQAANRDRKSTRLNSSHSQISYAVFCLKKKKKNKQSSSKEIH